MLNYTNYAIPHSSDAFDFNMLVFFGTFVTFSGKSDGNILLICSFRIRTFYLCPCFKLPLLDLRRKVSHDV